MTYCVQVCKPEQYMTQVPCTNTTNDANKRRMLFCGFQEGFCTVGSAKGQSPKLRMYVGSSSSEAAVSSEFTTAQMQLHNAKLLMDTWQRSYVQLGTVARHLTTLSCLHRVHSQPHSPVAFHSQFTFICTLPYSCPCNANMTSP